MTDLGIAGLVVAFFAAVGALLGSKHLAAKRALAKWRPIADTGLFFLPEQIDETSLAFAVRRSAFVLFTHGPWQPADVWRAIDKWKISVRPTLKWISEGKLVAGQTNTAMGVVEVGSDLAALAHELAHVCEFKLQGFTDDAHKTWASRGLTWAEKEYLKGPT